MDAFMKDHNVSRASNLVRQCASDLPSATGRYLLEKVPAVQWLPRYAPRWIVNDSIAGLTVGVVLVPQALAYAKIAGIPLQDGLLAAWLPSILYFIMGTSKDANTGPTSIIGLLTAQIIKDVSAEGYTSTAIAVAISFSVGVYCLVLGLLKLGFLLELVSHPVLTGFISAAAITIIVGQVPAIFGETDVGSGVANQIHDIFAKLPRTKPVTLVVGIVGILMLVAMQVLGQRYGKRSKVMWIVSIGRNAITILLFTVISFVANRNIQTPIFALTGKIPAGLLPPRAPDMALVGRVFSPSLAVFLAAALEHIAIAKSFGRKNHYAIDPSQELTFLGVANVLNSFMGGMAVGGAASRTAVNSESGVKSPLYGLFTAGTVLVSIYALTGALFWIPKATLSAVIIVAVWSIVASPSVFVGYWNVSLVDFTASQIAFWVTLFVSAEMGIELATGFMLLCTILQTLFLKGRGLDPRDDLATYYPRPSADSGCGIDHIPAGTAVVRFSHPIIFLNASRAKASILDTVQAFHSGAPAPSSFSRNKTDPDRLWNELGTQHIARLRERYANDNKNNNNKNISPPHLSDAADDDLPQIRLLVIDFSSVIYIDETGILALQDTQTELKAYAGTEVPIRFVGMKQHLVGKLERVGWNFSLPSISSPQPQPGAVVLYHDMREAITSPLNKNIPERGCEIGDGKEASSLAESQV
ncbi:uncharacterized protein L3040_004479 [Drepanopeziza brunnea f. sp. 'multigermtubi']|uniref:Putative sulfate permease n=1 Tax=Marssonina brunnea f. sp. multigermtubi (strain MB_m1) TaxID=1072389 RepID=K1XB32_MARBU|nr:putative sulfate permease [Drepanopeziza brunnea f. sp. 'multigermtubi' MB_m1]EKD17938.1 putative sulfate permease [Drepanopeziza brunnea f. sp. 'multigermtubi' MB_m1]KAJ5043093.1 hypothetical protein L3040_004479 [Drepanopeziza brunnea f. sp. 'multigermtubi']